MYYCDGTNWHAKYTADNIKKEEAIEEDDAELKYL
jgi:CDGSH-type Zn-finger protein